MRQAAPAAGLAFVERRAGDETFPCRLWSDPVGLIHVYQTDSSSKPPAPKAAFRKTNEKKLKKTR